MTEHTTEQALAMITVGATRIGTSHTAAILNGVPVDFSPT